MPVALQGAVIVKQNGLQISYKRKCEKCGYLENSTVSTSAPSTKSSKSTSSFRCPKCGNQQKIEIQGGL
jgi:hypothetical protein